MFLTSFAYKIKSAIEISIKTTYSKTISQSSNTLTETTLATDFSIGKYRSKLYNEDFTLTITYEHGNTYSGWSTYRQEWLFGYLDNNQYFEQNNLSLTRERRKNDTCPWRR